MEIITDSYQKGCRGGARWHQDVYRFGKNGTLEWISTKENTGE
ncbi:hypothetical protein [Chryseobacterium indologenes]|nr:hypothetical protein [Chryseobacterium indologenes]